MTARRKAGNKQQSVTCVCSNSVQIDLVCCLPKSLLKYAEGKKQMSQDVFRDAQDSIPEI